MYAKRMRVFILKELDEKLRILNFADGVNIFTGWILPLTEGHFIVVGVWGAGIIAKEREFLQHTR